MKMFRRFESYILRMDIIKEVSEHFKDQKHSGDGMCLKIALWAWQRNRDLELFYNSGHVVCCWNGVCFDGGGIVHVREEDGYMSLEGFGHGYFSRTFEQYLTSNEQLTLTRYFKMSLSKQIKELERSIASRTQFISGKQAEIQATNAALQEVRQQAQAALQEWQAKIDKLTADLNQEVQEVTASHEAKLREEGRLELLQEQFTQSGETEAQEAPREAN